MKKIATITMILVLSFAMVFVFPSKQAHAIGPILAAEGAFLGGAAVYVGAAITVGAIAAVAGCESCQQDIEAHAQRTWDGSTQLAKDGLQAMVNASVGAWGATSSAFTATDSRFNTWMDGQIDSLAQTIANSKVPEVTTSNNYTRTKGVMYLAFNMTGALDFAWGAEDSFDGRAVRFEVSGSDLKKITSTGTMYVTTSLTYLELDQALLSITTPFQMAALWNTYAPTSNNPTYDLSVVVNSVAWNETYNQAVSQTREAWQDMKDAGLVLPTDNARPMYNNQPVTYDSTTDAYVGIDGVAVPRDGIEFEYQKPHWKTVDELTALGLTGAGAGLYIDGWASSDSVTSTYDPTADVTTTVTTGTTTGVTTGVTSTTTTTTTTTGDTTGNPPVNPPPVTPPKAGEPVNPFKGVVPGASILSLFQLLVAIIWYLIRMFTFVATIAFIAPTPIDNPYFMWFTEATFYGITPFPLVQNLALFFLGFSIYKSIRRVF